MLKVPVGSFAPSEHARPGSVDAVTKPVVADDHGQVGPAAFGVAAGARAPAVQRRGPHAAGQGDGPQPGGGPILPGDRAGLPFGHQFQNDPVAVAAAGGVVVAVVVAVAAHQGDTGAVTLTAVGIRVAADGVEPAHVPFGGRDPDALVDRHCQ